MNKIKWYSVVVKRASVVAEIRAKTRKDAIAQAKKCYGVDADVVEIKEDKVLAK